MMPKILFVGLDSAEPTLLDRWCDEGTLPNLATLRSRGIRARVDSAQGFGNGAVWPSLFTGLNPGGHGRYWSRQLKPGTYELQRFDTDRGYRADPFWVALGRQGVRVGVVDMVRAPLTRGMNGFQVAEWLTHDPRWDKTRSFPDSLIREVAARYGEGNVSGKSEEQFPDVNAGLEEYLAFLLDRIERKTEMTLDYARRHDCHLFMSVYGEPHDAGHRLWHLHDPTHQSFDPAIRARHGDPLRRVYEAIDRGVGRLIEGLGDTIVMVFAGPGMQPGYTANHGMGQILDAVAGRIPTIRRPRPQVATPLRRVVRRAVPRRLRAALRPFVPEVGATGEKAIFPLPNVNTAGAIRFNLVGREPKGRISPSHYDDVCADLTRRFLGMKNAETGTPLVESVIKVHETCSGSALDMLPDLLVVWNRDAPIRSVEIPGVGCLDVSGGRGSRTGDHSANCSLVVAGPGIEQGRSIAALRVEDLAPTIAAQLGRSLDHTDGVVVGELAPALVS